MQNWPQTAKKRPQTGPTVTVRGGTAGTGAGGGKVPVVGRFQHRKDGFLRDFSAVLADFHCKRLVFLMLQVVVVPHTTHQ